MGLWPWSSRSKPATAVRAAPTILPGYPIIAGGYAHVDGGQISNAQQSIAVRSTVDLIASVASELPIDYFTGKGTKRRQITPPTYMEDVAGDGYGTPDWIYQWVYSMALRGNAYGNILDQSPTGVLKQVSLFHPDSVTPVSDGNGGFDWYANNVEVGSRAMKHWRMNPIPGSLLGLSPISAHATTIGTNLSANRFGKSWFDSEAHPSGILKNTKKPLTPDQSKEVKRRFMEALFGGSNRREPIVMGEAWEWQGIQVDAEDSQFLETMGFSAAECCRIFGPGFAEVLGYETGGTMTYSNVQDKDIQLLKYGLNKWLTKVERVLSAFLPRPQYVILNRDALLQTNTLQRYQAHQIALGGKAWMFPDETREIEDLPEREAPGPTPVAPADPVPGEDDPEQDEQEETEVPA